MKAVVWHVDDSCNVVFWQISSDLYDMFKTSTSHEAQDIMVDMVVYQFSLLQCSIVMIFLPNSNSCPERDFQLAPSHQPCFLKGNFMLCMLSQINCSPSFWELQSPVYWYLCCFCFVQIQIFCFERLCGVSCATVLWQLHLWDAWSSSSSVLKDFGAVVERQQRPGGPQGRGSLKTDLCLQQGKEECWRILMKVLLDTKDSSRQSCGGSFSKQ